MSDSSRTKLSYIAETTWGTTPGTPTLKELRMTGESIGKNIANIASSEIREDRQITDLIQTGADVSGGFQFELSADAFTDMFEGAMLNSWNAAVAIANASDVSATTTDDSYNSTTTNFVTEGIVAGQWINVAGFINPVNNGFHQVVSVSANKIVVAENLSTESAPADVDINGTMISNGSTVKSFTMEKTFDDITQFLSFTGMMVNSMSMNISANEIVSGSFDFIGKDAALAQSTIASSLTPAPTKDVMNAVSNVASIKEAGSTMSSGLARGLTINLNNNLRGRDGIGVLGNTGIGVGTCTLTGTLSAYFEDETLLDKYYNGTESSISVVLAKGTDTIIIDLPRVKFSGGTPTAGGQNQDVMVDLEFQALRHASYDYTIQISRF